MKRKEFVRNIALSAMGMFFIGGKKKVVDIQSFAPPDPNKHIYLGLFSIISSVQPGSWHDPATWGGAIPGNNDSAILNHNVSIDQAVTCSGIEFNPDITLTLTSTKNIILSSGKLTMKPQNNSVIHTIRFTNVNENLFVGGGEDPVSSDVGLWIMGSAQLDLVGTSKTSWTNALDIVNTNNNLTLKSVPLNWNVGDEIAVTPTAQGDYTGFENRTISSISGAAIAVNTAFSFQHPKVQNWTAEVMNLTRNVRIEGTASGKSHVFIRSSLPHTVKDAQFRYLGPRKNQSGSAATEKLLGRYALHFHHSMDGSRGSIVDGCVVRDTDNNSFVTHGSHGINILNCIAYNVTETPYWWDEGFGHSSHDIIWDGCIAALVKYIPGSINMDDVDLGPNISSRGFLLGHGDNNVCINCVAVGTRGDNHDGGGYKWEAVNNDHLEGVWIFKNNLSHNNSAAGLLSWQNVQMPHVIEDYYAYNNSLDIYHGAYANNYRYVGGSVETLVAHAASGNAGRIRFEKMKIDSAVVEGSPLDGALPILFRGCEIGTLIDAVGTAETHNVDVVMCSGTFTVHPQANPAEVMRIQPTVGQALRKTNNSTTNIPDFAPKIWSDGTGLTGEYYNQPNFLGPVVLLRVDPYIAFTEWNNGIHYKITSKQMSVRWTGQIIPQFTENYTFIWSGGIWINGVQVTGSINLTAGQKYQLRLQFSNSNSSFLPGPGFGWQSTNINKFSPGGEYVPQSQLLPSGVAVPLRDPIYRPPQNRVSAFTVQTKTIGSVIIKSPGKYVYTVHDAVGRFVEKGELLRGTNEIYIKGSAGIYILKINSEHWKIMKTK